jgi:hypothetical protein
MTEVRSVIYGSVLMVLLLLLGAGDPEDTAGRVFEQPQPRLISVEKLQEDFKQLRQALEDKHCCLYEYTDKAAFDSLFARQYALVDKSMSLRDFFAILTPITGKVGCGHTAVRMPDSYWDGEVGKMFPLEVKLVEDYLVVTGSYADTTEVPIGSIILEINGQPVSGILETMKVNCSADAFNEYLILSQVERRFSTIYGQIYGFPGAYRVVYAPPGRKTREIKDLHPASIAAVRSHPSADSNRALLSLEVVEARSAAVMTVRTFAYYDRVTYFRGFIDSCFAVIREKEVGNLILDLRGNSGGDPFCAAALFSYLEPRPVPYFADRYGNYAHLADPIPLADRPFTGNLFTLIDGRCFSTSGHFCSLLKYHGIGKFVGTPTGSSYKCNAGNDTEVDLKNTSIALMVGRTTYAAAVEGVDKNRPIMPDYPVKETYRGFLAGQDAFLDAVWALVNRAN